MLIVGLLMALGAALGVAAGLLILVGSFFVFPPAPFLIVGYCVWAWKHYDIKGSLHRAIEKARQTPPAPIVRPGSTMVRRRPSVFAAPVVFGSEDDDFEEDSP